MADSPSTKLRDDPTLNKYLIRCCKDDFPIEDRTLTAFHSGTHEHLPGLFICNDKLGSDSFESVLHGTENVATPVSPSHLRNFVETAPTLRSYGQFAQGSGAFDLPIRKLSYEYEQFV